MIAVVCVEHELCCKIWAVDIKVFNVSNDNLHSDVEAKSTCASVSLWSGQATLSLIRNKALIVAGKS